MSKAMMYGALIGARARRGARSWLAGLVGLGLWTACAESQPQLGAIERPNILLISLDTLRADFLGCYGFEQDSSPAIDRLAATGTRFLDVTSASPWTLPSHASLLSGLYPSRHGVTDKEFRLTKPTLPKLFKAAGYRTLSINNALLVGHPKFNLMEGFEQDKYEPEQREGYPTLNSARPIIEQAMAWLGEVTQAQPFFMFLHFYDAHTDFTPDQVWRDKFVGPYTGKLTGNTMQLVETRLPGRAIDAKDTRWLREMYAAEIRTLDQELGRLFEFLERSRLTPRTIVAITSDHGEEFMEHGGVLHGRTHYQELLRIPLILSGPGIPVGGSFTNPVHLIDVAPTLLKLGGVELPELDGLDLGLHWLAPRELPKQRFLFSEADHNNVQGNNLHRMVRLDQFKLHFDTHTGKQQLFDLRTDPGEQQDLSQQQPAVAQRLRGQLDSFMAGKTNGLSVGPLQEDELELLDALGYGESGADAED